MPYREPARTAAHRTQSTILALVVVSAGFAGVLMCQSPAASSSPVAPGSSPVTPSSPASRINLRDGHCHSALGEADGVVPDGVTVFDDRIPAVSNLDPDLLGALRQAATDAANDGVAIFVNSGWRSPQYQEQLLREMVRRYGSEEEAARWVATADTSAHVSGDAIDIGHVDARAWLSDHGAEYGLCQIYRNEPWHYELRPEATDRGCPRMYIDPTDDPRLQE